MNGTPWMENIKALQLRVSKLENTLSDLMKEKASAKSPPKSKEFRMPFGKHKGLSFSEIHYEDENYLDWIEENMDNERIQEELMKWKGV